MERKNDVRRRVSATGGCRTFGRVGQDSCSLALLLEAGRRNIPVRALKKGPDYIDAALARVGLTKSGP